MLELEVKVLNIDADEMEKKLQDLGAVLIGKKSQVNTVYDTDDRKISGGDSRSYMRIREELDNLNGGQSSTLTMKQLVESHGLRKSKETNVRISSKDDMEFIMSQLGVKTINVGKKERTSYVYEDIRFDIDIWDKETYPHPYMEIEVKCREDLEKAKLLLGISDENVSTKSIKELRKEIGLEQ